MMKAQMTVRSGFMSTASTILPGTGTGTAARSGVVEGAPRVAIGAPHHASHGPLPRAGEDLESVSSFRSLASVRTLIRAAMADRGGGGDAGGADRGLGGPGLARVRRMGHQLQYVERPGREDGEIDDDEGDERGTDGGRGERRHGVDRKSKRLNSSH